MGGIQISGSGTIVPNEYIKPCIDEIFQVFKKHFPEEMQTTEIITVILDLAKAGDNTFTKSIVYERKLLKNVAA